ncbi:hypothetical protein [Shewanella algae]|uniref:hypothetical protein n=1 Tax=Shewanella algae TaxID=38313 RepID=UPI000D1C1AD9|nr:hypothetical protein [Shewanella algae]PSS73023.1 hypothetical protein AYI88_10325 [Shewanella algae]TVL46717.1 hypothetical protein AYI98_14355 [Shewanella algae]
MIDIGSVLSEVVENKSLDEFRGARLSTAELIAVMGSAMDTDRRRERLAALGKTESEVNQILLDESSRQLELVKNGAIVPTRGHGDKTTLSEN